MIVQAGSTVKKNKKKKLVEEKEDQKLENTKADMSGFHEVSITEENREINFDEAPPFPHPRKSTKESNSLILLNPRNSSMLFNIEEECSDEVTPKKSLFQRIDEDNEVQMINVGKEEVEDF